MSAFTRFLYLIFVTFSYPLIANVAEDLVDSPDCLLVFNNVAVFGGDHDKIEILDGDIQKGILVGLDIGVLLIDFDELWEG